MRTIEGREQEIGLPDAPSREDLLAGQRALMNGWAPGAEPVVMVRGSGSFVWDSQGRRYLDCISQAWALNIGHCHPRVMDAADRQARTLSHVRNNFGNIPLLLLAKRMAELLPGRLNRVAFSLHGSTAVETAMKLAIRNAPGAGGFVTLYDAYHGRTLGAMSLSWPHPHNRSAAFQRESVRVPQAYCYRCPLHLQYPSCGIACADLVRDAMRKGVNGGPTAMIMEPMQGNGIQAPFPVEYLRAVRQICDEEGVLLIWDEVQSAFGRIPAMFAADYYDVTPDILVFGKALGGGYPIAGVGMRDDLQEFEAGEDALTFGHFPVSAAAALAALDVLEEEGVFANCERQGAYITAKLKEMQERYELIGDVRGPGLAIGIELVRDRETKEPAYEETTRFCELAMARGVIFGSTKYHGMGNVVKFKPPATITREEADLGLNVFEDVLREVSRGEDNRIMAIERVELAEVDLPEFGVPVVPPTIPASTYDDRIAAARRAAAAAGHDVLIVYGDREHFANMAYLTGFDPRFEEALLILTPDRTPTLVVGMECMGYSVVSPVNLNRVLYRSFSLLSMPRGDGPPLGTILREAGVASGSRVGMAGWKYYLPIETPTPDQWMEVPSFIVDTLRGIGAEVRNATALFMNPESGLRAANDLDQLAYFEFASSHGSQGVRDVLFNLRAGMTDFEGAQLMRMNGLAMAYHPLVEGGPRALTGLASAAGRVLTVGDPMMAAYGPWGSNTARAGYLTADAESLPPGIRDTMDKLIKPYFTAIADQYEHLGVGVPGGELWEVVHHHIGDPFFNVALNPGHLIHLDEWLSSPIYRDSTLPMRSGMAIQVDVIPATGTDYHMIIIEDTIALADETLRAAFAERYPEAWSRIQRRRAFMQDVLHIKLKPEVLPFSNIPAYAPPFWLSPRRTMRVV